MRWRTAYAAVLVTVVVGGLAAVGYGLGLYELPGENRHDDAVVTLVGEDGTELATVTVSVADTRKERIQGLSGADSLANGTGMLFVHGGEVERTYVMREMDFGLDIVFVDANRTVTAVYSAPRPDPDADELTPYSGRAMYVLEVPKGFADHVGLDEGDRIRIRYTD